MASVRVKPFPAWVVLVALACAGDSNETRHPVWSADAWVPSAIDGEGPTRVSDILRDSPVPVSPMAGAVFDHVPRFTVLVWQDMPGARSYIIQVEYCSPSCSEGSTDRWARAWVAGNAYAFEFVAANPGRWRVRGVDSSGAVGPYSDWSHFEFTR